MAKKVKKEAEPTWAFLEGEEKANKIVEEFIWQFGVEKTVDKVKLYINEIGTKRDEVHKGMLSIFNDYVARQGKKK